MSQTNIFIATWVRIFGEGKLVSLYKVRGLLGIISFLHLLVGSSKMHQSAHPLLPMQCSVASQ